MLIYSTTNYIVPVVVLTKLQEGDNFKYQHHCQVKNSNNN
jgi:hypothetical protein